MKTALFSSFTTCWHPTDVPGIYSDTLPCALAPVRNVFCRLWAAHSVTGQKFVGMFIHAKLRTLLLHVILLKMIRFHKPVVLQHLRIHFWVKKQPLFILLSLLVFICLAMCYSGTAESVMMIWPLRFLLDYERPVRPMSETIWQIHWLLSWWSINQD